MSNETLIKILSIVVFSSERSLQYFCARIVGRARAQLRRSLNENPFSRVEIHARGPL